MLRKLDATEKRAMKPGAFALGDRITATFTDTEREQIYSTAAAIFH